MSLLSQGGGPRHVSGVDLAPCICAGLLPRELNVPDPVSPSGLGLHVAPMGLSEEVRLEKTRGGHSGLPRSSIKNCRLLPHPTPQLARLTPAYSSLFHSMYLLVY